MFWRGTRAPREAQMFCTAKRRRGASLGTSGAEVKVLEGRGVAIGCGRSCSSGGRGRDSQWIGNASGRTQHRSCGEKNARFTQYVVRAKAKELMCRYLKAQLEAGVKLVQVDLRSRWFSSWRHEYGLSLRKPNRRYKVSRAVLAERLQIGWLNVYRVRAAVAALKSYDPHMENWDQSPFHHNETGSENKPTLAVAGLEVPLVEQHNATRARWSANLTTFSDHARLSKEGPPYAEHMFKADGEILLERLQNHVRKRGYGKWVSVATSEKGSYRTEDVLNFLEKHLPQLRPEDAGREWRIMMADDHRPHLSPHVARLCWKRGYVFIPHWGRGDACGADGGHRP